MVFYENLLDSFRKDRIVSFFYDFMYSYPVDGALEKNERLFQTYVILFGLLLSYTQLDKILPSALASMTERFMICWFMGFMFFGLIYYVCLTRFSRDMPRFCLNLLAVLMAVNFSGAFFTLYVAFAAPSGWFSYLIFIVFTVLIAVSLFV